MPSSDPPRWPRSVGRWNCSPARSVARAVARERGCEVREGLEVVLRLVLLTVGIAYNALGAEEIVAPAGTFVLVPPEVQHSFENRTSQPVRILNIYTLAGFDLRCAKD